MSETFAVKAPRSGVSWPLPVSVPPKGVAESDWRDWGWQMRHRIRTADSLREWIDPTPEEEEAIADLATRFRFVITPYFASLMDPQDPNCPIRRQVVPRPAELEDAPRTVPPTRRKGLRLLLHRHQQKGPGRPHLS